MLRVPRSTCSRSARARDAVITPDVLRLAFEEVNRLHFACMEKGHQPVPYGADVFGIEYQPIRGSASNTHAVNRFAGQVILLMKV